MPRRTRLPGVSHHTALEDDDEVGEHMRCDDLEYLRDNGITVVAFCVLCCNRLLKFVEIGGCLVAIDKISGMRRNRFLFTVSPWSAQFMDKYARNRLPNESLSH